MRESCSFSLLPAPATRAVLATLLQVPARQRRHPAQPCGGAGCRPILEARHAWHGGPCDGRRQRGRMGGMLHLHARGSDLVAGAWRIRVPRAIHARGLPAANARAVGLLRVVPGPDVPRLPQRVHQLAHGIQTGAAQPIAPASPSRQSTLALSSVPRAVCPTRA